MKINKFNFLYIIGIFPLFLIMNLLVLKIVHHKAILFYTLMMIFLFINYKIFKKIMFLPKKPSKYNNLKPLGIKLPIKEKTPQYSSKDFDKHDLVVRTVEILSPLIIKEDEDIKLIISEKLLKNRNESFIRILITREILKYRSKSEVKIILSLVAPILFMVDLVLGIIIINNSSVEIFNSFVVNFAMPFVMLITFSIYIYNWNKFMSQEQSRIDQELLKYFSVEEIISYIRQIENIERRNEKEKYKKFNERYSTQRINKIKNNII